MSSDSGAEIPRYEIITTRTTSRGSSYGVYDNKQRTIRPDLGTTRDKATMRALVKSLNEEEAQNG